MSSVDPFASPSAKTIPGMHRVGSQHAYPEGFYQPIHSFDVVRMISGPFKSPQWAMNLLWMFVCELGAVIVIGRIVSFGYLAEVAESRSGGRSENWPDFNPDRFTDYLMRGLWPFLWNIIWTLPMILLVGIPVAITVGLSSLLSQNNNEIPGMIVALVGISVAVFLFVCVLLAMFASMMHSALGNDFIKGADLKWIWSFLSKAGSTTVVALIIYVLVGFVTSIAGALFFCVGIFLVAPMMYLMGADLIAQLHDIFVSRGGIPALEVPQQEVGVIEAQVVL